MKLPVLSDFDFSGKRVLVRCDFDGGRLEENLPTVKYLLDGGAKQIILMGHLGRPLRQAQGKLQEKVVEELRIAPIEKRFRQLLDSEKIIFLENLRFDPREEKNDLEFAKELAGLGDFYVNEAFAVSHREHASIVGVPKFLPHCAGLHFASEIENLTKILEKPEKPLVFVIGGAKPETKLAFIESFARIADTVLIGGLLVRERVKVRDNIIYADLVESGLDISEDSIKKFEGIITSAGTVVWNGPMGKFEDKNYETGTRKISQAMAESSAFKVVGGGDTISALKKFNLIDKMDYVSTGGGAMLEFLAKGTLLGIMALL